MYIYTPFSKVRLEKKKASKFYSPRVREGLKFKNNYDLHDVKHKTILYENNKTKKKNMIELLVGQNNGLVSQAQQHHMKSKLSHSFI